jgi:hypothetical protein
MALVLVAGSVTLGGSSSRTVQMLDACDGPSFNAVLGEGACAREEGVTFDELIGQLLAMGSAPAWRFSPGQVSLATDGTITAVNRGGEFHTFTEVAAFGGGCINEINALLGLTAVPECAQAPGIFFTTGAIPGGTVTTGPLAGGTHFFECLIHPWMRSTVVAD